MQAEDGIRDYDVTGVQTCALPILGYVISVILVAFSLFSLWVAFLALKGKDYATVQKGGGGLMKRDLKTWEKVGCYAVIILILLMVLSPHIGLALLSFGTVWSYSVLPDAFTIAHYENMFRTAGQYISNTLLYAGQIGRAHV